MGLSRHTSPYFASYHAYPYYPDFLRHEKGLRAYVHNGHPDPYGGYLAALKRHHAGMPVMITEFGVPSSIGSAHSGPLGRDQGGHSEQQAMAIDADLLRLIHGEGLAGGFLFSWTDEWFKFTWNTLPRQIPADRRELWHDPWTNEQWFGILAEDAGPPNPAGSVIGSGAGELRQIRAATDESWVHLTVRFAHRPTAPVRLGFDVVPGGAGHLPDSAGEDRRSDYAIVLDPQTGRGQAWRRQALDPLPLDYPDTADVDPPVDGWVRDVLSTDRPLTVPSTGQRLPYEIQPVGALRRGNWDPSAPGYDSRAAWQLRGAVLRIRVPWMEIGIADPSSKRALVPHADGVASTRPVRSIGLVVSAGDATAGGRIDWQPWQRVSYTERIKAGAGRYAAALHAVSTPRS